MEADGAIISIYLIGLNEFIRANSLVQLLGGIDAPRSALLLVTALLSLPWCPLPLQTEWEALELTDHQWALDDVEEELMAKDLHFEGMFKKELQTSIF